MIRTSGKADRIFLLYLGALVIFGLAALMSATSPLGFAKFHDAYFYIKRQVFLGLIPGIILFLVCAKLDYHVWQRFSYWFYGFAMFLLALVFIPGVGVVINHSRSWISLGNFSFQPSELAKLAVIILAAYLLTAQKRNWNNWQESILPVLTLLTPAVLLVLLQPDIGTVSIMVVALFVILYAANVPTKYLLFLSTLGIVCFVGLILAAPYRAQRLTTFLHPELDPQGVGYQMNQAFLAVGSGGFWGLGFGHSRQKFQYLPEVNADSIFAIIAEELGFFISLGIILMILGFTFRGFKIARGAPDEFGYLLVIGIMVWFVWQSFLNIGAMVGALPLTGVPLPFISHGGSALMTALAAAGIVTNVSKTSKL